jgi:hypothetical protein
LIASSLLELTDSWAKLAWRSACLVLGIDLPCHVGYYALQQASLFVLRGHGPDMHAAAYTEKV